MSWLFMFQFPADLHRFWNFVLSRVMQMNCNEAWESWLQSFWVLMSFDPFSVWLYITVGKEFSTHPLSIAVLKSSHNIFIGPEDFQCCQVMQIYPKTNQISRWYDGVANAATLSVGGVLRFLLNSLWRKEMPFFEQEKQLDFLDARLLCREIGARILHVLQIPL